MVIRQEQWVTTNRRRHFLFGNVELEMLNEEAHKDLVLDHNLTMEDVRDAINGNGDTEVAWKDDPEDVIHSLNDYIMDYLSDLMDDECTDDDWYYFNQDVSYNEFSTVKAEEE